MKWGTRTVLAGLAFSAACCPSAWAQRQAWRFAVSGDSRNCGDVVMPAIAAGVKDLSARFYWHLGDLRWISDIDQDIRQQPEHLSKPLSKPEYLDMAWDDFALNQMAAFTPVPFYLGIGNHDTVPPKNHDAFVARFRAQLDRADLREQRLRDDPGDLEPHSYYHWITGGVDFIYLDNATGEQFEPAQMAWFEKVLSRDSRRSDIRSFVVGMHEALPESISKNHSMNQSEGGTTSGMRVYHDLLDVRNHRHRHVYIIASHSHYFMDGTFNTTYWRTHGGVLPGWIVGTAGAVRYRLPPDAGNAQAALTDVYGFLAGTVDKDGAVRLEFQRLSESGVPEAIRSRYTPQFVHWCFAENSQAH